MEQKIISIGEAKLGYENNILVSLGLGSCVGIVLYEPEKKIAALGHVMLPDSSENKINKETNENIMLAVPSEGYYSILKNMLQKNSYNLIESAIDSNNLLNLYYEKKPSVVLLDNQLLPSGTANLENILSKDSNAKVLMMCRSYDRKLHDELIQMGASDVIFTPYYEERVEAILRSVLKNYMLKYADIMIPYMIESLSMIGVERKNIVAKIAGGGQMFAVNTIDSLKIGERNVKHVKELLSYYNIKLIAEETGGNYGRTVMFTVATQKFSVRTKNIFKDI